MLLGQIVALTEGRGAAHSWHTLGNVQRRAIPIAAGPLPRPLVPQYGGFSGTFQAPLFLFSWQEAAAMPRRRPCRGAMAESRGMASGGSAPPRLSSRGVARRVSSDLVRHDYEGSGTSWEDNSAGHDRVQAWEEVEWMVNGRYNGAGSNGHGHHHTPVEAAVNGRRQGTTGKHADIAMLTSLEEWAKFVRGTHATMGRERVARALNRLEQLWRARRGDGGCQDAMEAAHLVMTRAKSTATGMTPLQLCMVMSCLAQLEGGGVRVDDRVVKVLGARAVEKAEDFDPYALLSFLRSLSALSVSSQAGQSRGEVVAALMRRAVQLTPQYVVRVLASMLWVVAKLGARPGDEAMAVFAAKAANVSTSHTNCDPFRDGRFKAHSAFTLGRAWSGLHAFFVAR